MLGQAWVPREAKMYTQVLFNDALFFSLFSLLSSSFFISFSGTSIKHIECLRVWRGGGRQLRGGGSVNDMSTEPGDTFVRQPHDVRRNCLSIFIFM